MPIHFIHFSCTIYALSMEYLYIMCRPVNYTGYLINPTLVINILYFFKNHCVYGKESESRLSFLKEFVYIMA